MSMLMASVYGLQIVPILLVTIPVSVILLSLGALSVTGVDPAIIVAPLSQIGISTTTMGLVMGTGTILDTIQAMRNTTSDAAIASTIAKPSGELDQELYR